MTLVVADTHVHLHPCHDAGAVLKALSRNLGRHGGDVQAAFFADRPGPGAIARLTGDAGSAGEPMVRPGPDPGTALLEVPGEAPVWLFTGLQVATAERLEVLALTLDAALPDGRPAAETVEAVISGGGVPVLCWSPGKWWFARGRIVHDLLASLGPGDVLVGDTAMRPTGTAEPGPMRAARARGIGVAAGTDPLPIAGDEGLAGSYVSVIEGEFDPERPLASMRALLRAPGAFRGTRGERGSWPVCARRWWRHRNRRKAGETASCAA